MEPIPLSERNAVPLPVPAPLPLPLPLLPPTPVGDDADDGIELPDFVLAGFKAEPDDPTEARGLRTVLGVNLGPDLWCRCAAQWSPGHCAALGRIARAVDGLAPSATTSLVSSAGAGLRWLGMTRDRDDLAADVAAAVALDDDASASNAARTLRLYGAAICRVRGDALRRCACHRDLLRDVSPELIKVGLDNLASPLT